MYGLRDILEATPCTEPATFWEFLAGLKEKPTKGVSSEWRDLFEAVRSAEEKGYVDVSRLNGNIECIQLTSTGVSTLKEMRNEK